MITELHANWYATPEGGDEYDIYEVGKNGVVSIVDAIGTKGNEYFVVEKENGESLRVYNPNWVKSVKEVEA